MAKVYALKACPRDGGDLMVDKDLYGEYISCLQCGYIGDKILESSENLGQIRTPNPQPTRGRNGKYEY